MLPNKLTLLEQINTSIKSKLYKVDSSPMEAGKDNSIDQLIQEQPFTDPNIVADRVLSISSLQHRVKLLENQNDRLLYFIHFLYKNFPELVKDIVGTVNDNNDEPLPMTDVTEKVPCCKGMSQLTRRELEILNLIIKGLGAKEIASHLFISESTVITHKKNLKEKFKARNTAELISKAFRISLE